MSRSVYLARGREQVLPGGVAAGVGHLSSEGVGQRYPAGAGAQVGIVPPADVGHLAPELGLDGAGEHGDAVVAALAAANDNLAALEGQALEADAEGLHQPEPGAVEQLGHESSCAARLGEDGGNLVA